MATIGATAASLLLMLWRRLPADDPAITWDGDHPNAHAALDRALVP